MVTIFLLLVEIWSGFFNDQIYTGRNTGLGQSSKNVLGQSSNWIGTIQLLDCHNPVTGLSQSSYWIGTIQ